MSRLMHQMECLTLDLLKIVCKYGPRAAQSYFFDLTKILYFLSLSTTFCCTEVLDLGFDVLMLNVTSC